MLTIFVYCTICDLCFVSCVGWKRGTSAGFEGIQRGNLPLNLTVATDFDVV